MYEIPQEFIAEIETYLKSPNGKLNNHDSGPTLAEVMTNIRLLPYEVNAAFDRCGRKIYEHTSHLKRSDATAVPIAYVPHIHLLVHNHPDGHTFSAIDLCTTHNVDVAVLMVVTPIHNYTLFRPSSGWPSHKDWIEEYDDIVLMLSHNHRYNDDTRAIQHRALSQVAKHYGIKYLMATTVTL